jgi:hypothetical protein
VNLAKFLIKKSKKDQLLLVRIAVFAESSRIFDSGQTVQNLSSAQLVGNDEKEIIVVR